MRKIINEPSDFVDEFLEGILIAHPGQLRAASADRRAIVRADAGRPGKVGIVTGGGSGHLPAFLGYVGRGLCDGVAVGNVFSSPSAEQVHAATRAVDGGAGVLYLYGNYGGDIYNFDLAAELAAADGIPTATVLAADDVASAPPERRDARRGVAGMVYAFKIAGAAAERGWPLERVAGVARRVAESTRTIGVGLSPTILPAADAPTFEIDEGEMEIGIGIHGEPGVHRGPLEPADAIADRLLAALVEDLGLPEGSPVSVLVNGLGATPLEELYVLYRRTAHVLAERGLAIESPFVGEYVTSLEAAGASISILPLDDELRELLADPAASPFFRHGGGDVLDVAPDEGPGPFDEAEEATGAEGGEPSPLAAVLLRVLAALPAHAERLRELDAALGDGDLGITVASGAEAAARAIRREPSAPDDVLLRRIGSAFASANPSTFAALVGGALVSASAEVADGLVDRAHVAAFARRAFDRIADRGGARLGDKTVLDAIAPSLEVLEAAAEESDAELVEAMAVAAERAIDELTPAPSARGRAAWLQERSRGRQDPGMTAYAVFLRELQAAIAG